MSMREQPWKMNTATRRAASIRMSEVYLAGEAHPPITEILSANS
jgi:hypothetical protein